MKITGAQAMIKCLENEKVEIAFGYPGAAIAPFYDSILDSNIKHILTCHEQGAAHAASGYARAKKKVGVCIGTSGPGATNLITGIATAYLDSIPMIIITGQVETNLIGRDVFQEVDITGATLPFCKHNYLIRDINDIPMIVKEAFYLARTGRPGPVLIDFPVDIQKQTFEFSYPKSVNVKGYKSSYKILPEQLKQVSEAISIAKKPLICAGGGIISASASELLIKLVEKCNIPVATTLMGIGSLPADNPLNLGMLGSHGSYAANNAVHNSDLLLIMGARVGDRAMGAAYNIAKKATIVHIDIDPAEIGKNMNTNIPIESDIKEFLEQLIEIVSKGDTAEWVELLQAKKEKKIKDILSKSIKPSYLLNELSDIMDTDTIITTEVGQNQIWAAIHIKNKAPNTFISSGGLGTMGYGLPAAIGAKFAKPDAEVVCISGDGSFQMNLHELGTIRTNDLGVKIILFNNSSLGMVRELQQKAYKRTSAVTMDKNPDFIKIADAYGIKGERIVDNSEVKEALKRLMNNDGPYLLECIVDEEESTL